MNTSMVVSDDVLEGIGEEIARLRAAKEYRPCVVILLQDMYGRFLFVRSIKGEGLWGFPQGGVDEGESVIGALQRELFEEVIIGPAQYSVRAYLGDDHLDIPEVRDGYTKGKWYFYFHCVCAGVPEVVLMPEELVGYHWVMPGDAEAYLARVSPEKRKTLLDALRRAQS